MTPALSLATAIQDNPDAMEAVFDIRAERRLKPTVIDPVAGIWGFRPTVIIKDAEGRIVVERMEDLP